VYRLAPPQHQQALAAVERYKTRLRLSDEGRSELLGKLTGILSREERDNMRAALERRPVVASGGITVALLDQLQSLRPFVGDAVTVTGSGAVRAVFVGDPVVPSSARPSPER
jgi:ferric-dicitrate binding protein FerR (iron transport regulator)